MELRGPKFLRSVGRSEVVYFIIDSNKSRVDTVIYCDTSENEQINVYLANREEEME